MTVSWNVLQSSQDADQQGRAHQGCALMMEYVLIVGTASQAVYVLPGIKARTVRLETFHIPFDEYYSLCYGSVVWKCEHTRMKIV